jgi:stringent starvation protein B
VAGTFAKENGQGLAFQTGSSGIRAVPSALGVQPDESPDPGKPRPSGSRPRLQVVK